MTKRLHKEDIKGMLRKRHGSMRAFERKCALPPLSIKDVLRGRASMRVETAIANDLELPLHLLFPDRYVASVAGESSLKRDNTARVRDTHRLSKVVG